MKLTCEERGQVVVMRPNGDLTLDGVDGFRKAAKERLEAHVRDFVIDGDGMDFIDSQGLETLLWLQEAASEQLGQVRLARFTDNARKILELTRLSMRFESHTNVEEALANLG